MPALLAILILGIFGTGISYVVNYTLIATEGPTTASVVTYLLPAVAVALGAVFLDEIAGYNLLGGVGLTLLGVALVQRSGRSESHGERAKA